MDQSYNVASAPKTTTFQMRINPEVKQRVEQVYANYGLNLTDAINIFIQQSLNMDGLPFLLSPENKEYMRAKAMKRLMAELDASWNSVGQDGWISEEDALHRLESNG
ncbi:MAG: type II toxin-antitoxin system RelB/DinJ family antitoxin [Butyricicoccus sp.]